MRINCTGPDKTSGLKNAYGMMKEALASCGHTLIEGYTGHEEFLYLHGSPHGFKYGPGRKRSIAYWVCESTELREHFHNRHEEFDDIWTASTFCAGVFERELGRKAKVIPHCARKYCYSPQHNETPKILIPFDFGSRFERKNPVQAIKACRDAFGTSCEVTLKTRNAPDSILEWMIKEAGPMPIKVNNINLSNDQFDELYRKTDIVLSLHHSEGFGLHLLEAMAFGKKVVSTDYGGSCDFVLKSNAWPVEAKEAPVNDPLFEGCWGYPDHDHAVEQLRAAADADETKCQKAFELSLNLSPATTALLTHRAL